jgi:TRAP-type C4-dicarboxylate transport system substrate-binding protein
MSFPRSLILAAACAVAAPLALAQTKLTYSSWFPGASVLHAGVVKPYLDRVEKETGLKYEIFTDSTLAGGRDTMGGLKNGTFDMGLIATVYHPGELKTVVTIAEASLMAKNTFAAAGAFNELMLIKCTDCQDEFKRQGVRPLSFHVSPAYSLMCNKKIATLAEMKGKRVRSASPFSAWVTSMGAIPVNLTSPETYEAMQRGQVDCVAGSAAWLNSMSLVDVVKYVSSQQIGGFAGGIHMAMSEKRWQQLTPAQRKSFLMNSAQAALDLNTNFARDDQMAVKQAVDAKKVEVVQAAPDFLAADAKHRAGDAERVAKLAERREVKDPAKLLADWQALLTKWEKIHADVKGDEQAFRKKMDEEIFSKISVQ